MRKSKISQRKSQKRKKKTQRKSKSFYLTLQNSQEKTHSRVYFNKYTGFTCVTLKTTHSLILFSTYFLNFPYANPKIVSKRQCFQNCSRYLFLVLSLFLTVDLILVLRKINILRTPKKFLGKQLRTKLFFFY